MSDEAFEGGEPPNRYALPDDGDLALAILTRLAAHAWLVRPIGRDRSWLLGVSSLLSPLPLTDAEVDLIDRLTRP